MLLKCPECELQVSNKANACPHCGYPMKQDIKPKRRTKKHMRLPNGFGQISEIKNRNLRKPFRAMVSVGKTSTGRPICKLLQPEAYFETYNDAYAALMEYNKNPYDLSPSIRMKELYEKWSEKYLASMKNPESFRNISAAWDYCSSIYDMRVSDVRVRHLKGCMDNGVREYKGELKKPSEGTKGRIKSMFNLMLDYAVEYEMTDKNYARLFDFKNESEVNSHVPFTDDEMKILWDNQNMDCVKWMLVQCYGGWRPQELATIRMKNVDLKNMTMIGGMKTKAGTDRVVPIHEKIKGIVEEAYQEALDLHSEYLFNMPDSRDGKFSYNKYTKRFQNLKEAIGLDPSHRLHDCRTHFITMAKKYKVDEYAIKRIVGHEIADITEKIYTKRDVSWLVEEMSKIEKSV